MKKRILVIVGLMVIVSLVLALTVPANIHGATSQTYTWKNVVINGGGYVPGIIFNTKQQNLIFARTDMGGAYKWNQSSKSWTQLLAWVPHDDWNWTGCESIATDPVDPNRLYLAVGTYTNSWTKQNGAIYCSTDQGATFTRTDLPFKLGGNMPGRNMGERLVIDPNKNSILFFGARSGNGLWKSADYGVTWTKVSIPDAGQYVQDPATEYLADKPGVCWVTFDPRTGTSGSATQTIYIGVATKGANNIYRSTNGGSTWSAVPGQPTTYLPHHGVLGSNGILYVTYSDTQGPYDGGKGDVYKYDTATSTWTQISPIPSSSSDDYFGYGGLAVDAQNPNTLMVASLNSWWPDAIIFRSTDAGATWKRIWEWTSYPSRALHYTLDISTSPWLDFANHNPIDPVPAVKLGWMIGDIKIDPFNSNRMFYGTGATIFGSENLTNWDTAGSIAIKSFAVGVEECAIMDFISPPSGTANLISVMGDIGGFKHTSLTTVPQEMYGLPYAGTYSGIDFAQADPNFVVRVGKGDPNLTYPGNLSTALSRDGGTTWNVGNGNIGGITGGGCVACNTDGTAVVWAPDGGMPSVSTDGMNAWVTCNGILTGAVVCSDRISSSKFYAFQNGTVYASTDKGKTFTAKATGFPKTAKIKAVNNVEGDVWLACCEKDSSDNPLSGDGLYHSTDSGATFTKVSGCTYAECVGFGMAASGRTNMTLFIYGKVDNVTGIYRSDDYGSSWVKIDDAQHQYGWCGKAISGDPRIYGRVYIATNGFGIVYGDGGTPVTGTPPATPTPTTRVNNTPTPTPTIGPNTNTPTPTRVNTPTPTRRGPTPTPTRRGTPTRRVTPTPQVTTNPTASPTPTRPGTPTPTTPRGGSYVVTYTISSDWGSGANADVIIKNNSTAAVNGWTLNWTFPGNQTITNLWNGVYTQSGASVSVKDAGYNTTIAANGGTVSFGFGMNYSGTNAKPTAFTLNGTPCTIQ
ncbi:MAG TPA: cellulose binding domain-containing protein [Bacillota bacterium]|nr:cellulose binding domain-containing protein [Bacillota bacterium]